MSLANRWAMAVMAFGIPIRALRLRNRSPNGVLDRWRDMAATRRAVATEEGRNRVLEEKTRPPVFLLLGERQSHDAKCFSVGKEADGETPHSEMTAWMVSALTQGIRVRSTPVMRICSVARSKSG